MNPNAMEKPRDLSSRLEFYFRRFFERIGGAVDFALRRGPQPGTDMSALIPQLESAVESNIKIEDSKPTAPNLFELRYDYENYTRMGQKRREYLQRELSRSLYEYIYNRRYATIAPVEVKIAYDAFTRGLTIKVDFGEWPATVLLKSGPANEAVENQVRDVVLRTMSTGQEYHATVESRAEPVGIGRNIANKLIIKDSTVSNFHAALVLRDDGILELADRASANGTYVNGVLLGSGDKTIVRPGDRLRFGDVEMTLEESQRE